jgi:hypothetical protein
MLKNLFRRIGPSISPFLWVALGTRNGGEVTGDDF